MGALVSVRRLGQHAPIALQDFEHLADAMLSSPALKTLLKIQAAEHVRCFIFENVDVTHIEVSFWNQQILQQKFVPDTNDDMCSFCISKKQLNPACLGLDHGQREARLVDGHVRQGRS